MVSPLTSNPFHQVTEHIAEQSHAMAGATIAASAALGCSLGEACVRISAALLEGEEQQFARQRVAARLVEIRRRLQELADEDGATILALAHVQEDRDGQGRRQDRLCQIPLEVGGLAAEAALLLQDFRVLARAARDDLEMAILLLSGTAHAAALLLDSNLRIWPEPLIRLTRFEPELETLRKQLQGIRPVERVRG
jgi:formiminotetrahydrofolate cyclodeaminase